MINKVGNILAVLGILIFVYSFIGRFIDRPTIGFTFMEVRATSGLLVANSFMLVSIMIKLWFKEK